MHHCIKMHSKSSLEIFKNICRNTLKGSATSARHSMLRYCKSGWGFTCHFWRFHYMFPVLIECNNSSNSNCTKIHSLEKWLWTAAMHPTSCFRVLYMSDSLSTLASIFLGGGVGCLFEKEENKTQHYATASHLIGCIDVHKTKQIQKTKLLLRVTHTG